MAGPVLKTLEQLFAKMTKDYGKGTIMTLETSTVADISHWGSTGIYSLDDAMNWGLAGGRILEWFGAESSGKTTALMSAFIENDRRGGLNVVVDGEGTFDQDRYRQMGGDPKKLIIVHVDTLEEFYDKLKIIIAWAAQQEIPANAVVLIGVDTLTTLIPKDVLEAVGDEQPVASASRVNARHLPTIDKNLPANTCLLLLSQVRDKIGGMTGFGPADDNVDTPGGRIVKHASSTRVFFKKVKQHDNGKKAAEGREITGIQIEAKVTKCKIGPPLRKIQFRVMFDHRGVDGVNNFLLDLVAKKIIPAPSSGVYSVKGKTFKAEGFAEFIKVSPKWTAWALDQCYELKHESVNIARYLNAKVVAEE